MTFSKNYDYTYIKSIDIIFIFLEIVKLTNSHTVDIPYNNSFTGELDTIPFGSDTFNYVKISMKKFDTDKKEFLMGGYRYSLPSIGVEDALTNFLITKSGTPESGIYSNLSYDFIYFLGNKNTLTFDEIENLTQIFNFDISEEDKQKVKDIFEKLSVLCKYSLKKDSLVVDLTSGIDLEKIWK